MLNEDVRADMLQKVVGSLQEQTKKAPDVYYIARLVDTRIRRIEVFCEYPATCSPDIPIRNESKYKPPAGSMTRVSPIVLKE